MASSGRGDIGGVAVSAITTSDVMDRVTVALDGRGPLRITFLNPDYLRRALRDGRLQRDINSFDMVLADGNGVRLIAPLFGFRIPQRLDTDSLAPRLFELLARRRARVFLFGCAPGVADRAAARLARAFDGIRVVGTEHGFHDVARGHRGTFDAADSRRIARRIVAARPDFLIVSLPTPLQQRWVHDFADCVEAPVVMTGGSYLDHIADSPQFPRSWYPAWVDAVKLNWAYRLVQEPGRLWRRYSLDIVDLMLLVLRLRVTKRPLHGN